MEYNMISNQILQTTVDGLKEISRVDLCVIDAEGKVVAKTFDNVAECTADALVFIDSPADSQVVNGYQFFKVVEDGNLEYIILAKGTTDDVFMLGKLAAFQKEFLEEVSREPVLLLLEADGAKHFPVKAPAEHEPVICEKTGIVLNVYGMRAIGKKIKDVCFRIGEVEKILGKTGEDILRPEDIMTLAVSRSAGRKCVTDEMEYQVILNQADTEEEKQTAMQLAEDIGKKLSEKYISEKNTKDTEFSGQISKVHVTSDLIPLEERW